jgi:hypothetical protein
MCSSWNLQETYKKTTKYVMTFAPYYLLRCTDIFHVCITPFSCIYRPSNDVSRIRSQVSKILSRSPLYAFITACSVTGTTWIELNFSSNVLICVASHYIGLSAHGIGFSELSRFHACVYFLWFCSPVLLPPPLLLSVPSLPLFIAGILFVFYMSSPKDLKWEFYITNVIYTIIYNLK